MSSFCRIASIEDKKLANQIIVDNYNVAESATKSLVDAWRKERKGREDKFPTQEQFINFAIKYFNDADVVDAKIHTVGKSYKERTEYNAKNSHITIAFASDFTSPGEKLTKQLAGNKYFPVFLNISNGVIVNDPREAAENFLKKLRFLYKDNPGVIDEEFVINIAGNTLAHLGIKQETLNNYVTAVLRNILNLRKKDNTPLFKSIKIISGGQTGADEAGIIAAQNCLILNWEINAPENYIYQNSYGVTILKQPNRFKNRFIRATKKPKEEDITEELDEINISPDSIGFYEKGLPQTYPNLDFVYTENAQAANVAHNLGLDTSEDPDEVALNVTKKQYKNSPNQAAIRTDAKGNLSENAYGIITKKRQQNKEGEFIKKEGQFEDTDEDFELFVRLNTDVLDKLQSSKNKKIFPTEMALGKSALPLRFAEWLQKELKERFGINTAIIKNKNAGYNGYGISLGAKESIVEGIEISSRSEILLGKWLSNLTKLKHGLEISDNSIRNAIGAEKEHTDTERTYLSVEHAYQTWKSGKFDEKTYRAYFEYSNNKIPGKMGTNKNISDQLMAYLLEEKLRYLKSSGRGKDSTLETRLARTQLDNNIKKYGIAFLEKSTHTVNGDKHWETSGDNAFIKALVSAYKAVFGFSPKEESNEKGVKVSELEKQIEGKTVAGQLERVEQTTAKQRLSQVLSPKKIRSRAQIIISDFSLEVDDLFNKNIAQLKERLEHEHDAVEKQKLQKLIANYTRFNAITSSPTTVKEIFDRIKEKYNSQMYLEKYPTRAIQNWVYRWINGSTDYNPLATPETTNYVLNEWQILHDYFEELLPYVLPSIEFNEGIRLNVKTHKVSANKDYEIQLSEEGSEHQVDIYTKEESTKEGWMIEVRHESAYNGLSERVKNVIRNIPRLIRDKEDGSIIEDIDDLNQIIFVDASYVHGKLLDITSNLIDSKDWIVKEGNETKFPALEQALNSNLWIEELLDIFKRQPELANLFYNNYRLDYLNMSVQTTSTDINGDITVKTNNINKPEGVFYLLDSWKEIYEAGIRLDKDTIYNSLGEISIDKSNIGIEIINKIKKKIDNYENVIGDYTEDEDLSNKLLHNILKDSEIVSGIVKVLRMVGVDTNTEKILLTINSPITSDIRYHSIQKLLDTTYNIFNNVKKGKVSLGAKEDGSVDDLFNSFSNYYAELADILKITLDEVREHSIRENGKSYFAHTLPAYTGKMIKLLKNVRPYKEGLSDEEYYTKMLEEEFGQYEWFKDSTTKKFMFGWLKRLEQDPEMRELIDHKVVLHRDKVEYADWESKEYALLLMHEYFNQESFAWYHEPVLSDSESAEFIKFEKIKGSYTDLDLSAETKIVQEFVGLAMQELKRIDFCKAKFNAYKNGEIKKDQLIEFFDFFEGKNGVLNPGNGHKFNFIPELNTYRLKGDYEVISGEDEEVQNDGDRYKTAFYINGQDRTEDIVGYTLQEVYAKLLDWRADSKDIEEVIEVFLYEVLHDKFNKDLLKWGELGIFDENSNPDKENRHIAAFRNNTTFRRAYKNVNKLIDSLRESGQFSQIEEYINREWDSTYAQEFKEGIKRIRTNQVVTYDMYRSVKEGLLEAAEDLEITIDENIDFEQLLPKMYHDMQEYFYNSIYATANIIQLFTTDLAYYKNYDDFIKRIKEIHAPSRRFNTQATWPNEEGEEKRVSDGWERSIYVADEFYDRQEFRENFLKAANYLVSIGKMTELTRDYILKSYDRINGTDAQAMRTVMSFRNLQIMAGEWDKGKEEALNRLLDPDQEYRMDDFSLLLNIKKPFVYSTENKKDITNSIKDKVPTQHKNAEYIMMVMDNITGNVLGRSAKMQAINDFMLEWGIDKIQFKSAVKVGISGVLDISQFSNDDYDSVYDYLKSKAILTDPEQIANSNNELYGGTNNGDPINYNTDVVHHLSYEDYGIQNQTPSHLEDSVQLIGTQIRKLISADISDDVIVDINGVKLTKNQWLTHFNRINTANIVQSFIEISEKFLDVHKLEEFLQEQVRNSYKYDAELAYALTLNEKGQFNIPLGDPVISGRVQSLLNSLLAKHVTKQRIKGGAAYQISSFAYNESLQIVWETGSGEIWNKDVHGEKEKFKIKYYECYLPMWSKDFVDICTNEDGSLDINKLPDELRKMVGYRIPTEDKYSMMPLYVKDFLPQQMGSVIMLPAEIVTQTGSDFDIDKLYLMIYEHTKRVKKYDLDRAAYEYRNSAEYEFRDLKKSFTQNLISWIEQDEFRQQMFSYDKPIVTLEKIQYDFTTEKEIDKDTGKEKDVYKDPEFNAYARQARNNGFIGLTWSILTHPDTLGRLVNPQGFEELVKDATLNDLLRAVTLPQLKEAMVKNGLVKADISDNDLIKAILKADNKTLTNISNYFEITSNTDPLSPITQVDKQQQLMAGANLIGIYANHNANHALVQHLPNLAIKAINSKPAITLNGVSRWKLNNVMTGLDGKSGDYISGRVSKWLGASVDNAKNPILKSLNQNKFTVNATMVLIRLGYNSTSVTLLLNQPIILQITQKYFREKNKYKDVEELIDNVISDYKKIIKESNESTLKGEEEVYTALSNSIDKTLKNETLAMGLLNNSSSNLKHIRQQIEVAYLFKKLYKIGEDLGTFVSTLRSDTSGGSAGPFIADTLGQVDKMIQFMKSNASGSLMLTGNVVPITIMHKGEIMDIDNPVKIFNRFMEEPLPYASAFFNLGLNSLQWLLQGHFPHFSKGAMEMIETAKEWSKRGNLSTDILNKLYSNWITYKLTATDTFNHIPYTDENGNRGYMNSAEAQEWYIKKFPLWFENIMNSKEHSEIAEVPFLQRLKVLKPYGRRRFPLLVFKNVGNLMDDEKARFANDWESLLYMEDPAAQELAYHLFMYSFFRNGLGYGFNGFSHLCPISIRLKFPEYIQAIRDLAHDKNETFAVVVRFLHQFIRNNLDKNWQFVQSMSKSTDDIFTTEDGKILDDIFITPKANSPASIVVWRTDNYGIPTAVAPYLYKRYNRKDYYYVHDPEYSYDGAGNLVESSFHYKRVQPLGLKNNFLEYRYNISADEMHSVDNKSLMEEYELTSEELESQKLVREFSAEEDYVPEDLVSRQSQPSFSTVLGKSITNIEKVEEKGDDNVEMCN